MKRIFTLLATCWVMQKAMAAFIPAGTMLYLDASKAWTNETSITARFSSDGMSAQEVAMTRTAGEQHIWQVSAPTPGPWTVVTFQSISGYQTAELIWGGYQSLYVVTCDACGSGQKAAGEWRYFTPLPEQNPGQLEIDYTDSVPTWLTPRSRLASVPPGIICIPSGSPIPHLHGRVSRVRPRR